MKLNIKVVSTLITVALVIINATGVLAAEIDPGIYLAARGEIDMVITSYIAFGNPYFGIYDSTLIENAQVGKAIRKYHQIDLSQIVVSNPEELLEKGLMMEYEVPLLIDSIPWISVFIHPIPSSDGKWDRTGTREAGADYLCYETLAVDDSVTSIEIDYFIFKAHYGAPIVHVALVKLNENYYLSPLNPTAANLLCGSECRRVSETMSQIRNLLHYTSSSDWG